MLISNFPAGGGAKVNGSVEQCVVAPGKTVAKGDFVKLNGSLTDIVSGSIYNPSSVTNTEAYVDTYGETRLYTCVGRSTGSGVSEVRAYDISPAGLTHIATLSLSGSYRNFYNGVLAVSDTQVLTLHGDTGSVIRANLLQISGSSFTTLKTGTVPNDDVGGYIGQLIYLGGSRALRTSMTGNKAVVIDWSGASIVFGSPVVLDSTTVGLLGANTIVTAHVASNTIRCQRATISGTSISVEAVQTLPSGLTGSHSQPGGAVPPGPMLLYPSLLVAPTGNTGILTANVADLDVSFSVPYIAMADIGSASAFSACSPIGPGRFAFVANGKIAGVAVVRQGSFLSVCTAEVFTGTTNTPTSRQFTKLLGNNRIIYAGYSSAGVMPYGLATYKETVEPAAAGQPVFGIAIENGSAGQTIKVAVPT